MVYVWENNARLLILELRLWHYLLQSVLPFPSSLLVAGCLLDCLPLGRNLFSNFGGMKFGLMKKFPEFMPLRLRKA